MKTIAINVVLAAALGIGGTAAQATVVDFQDVTSAACFPHGNGTLTSQGFNFNGNPADPALFVCNANIIQHNTSAALINANLRSILTMSQNGGGVFSMQSFFAGGRTGDFNINGAVVGYDVAIAIDIVGNVFGGGTVTHTVTLDSVVPYNWEQFFLPGTFTNLTSVVLTARGNAGADNTPEYLIDDIVANNAQQVPLPGSLALLGLGFAGLGLARRRRN